MTKMERTSDSDVLSSSLGLIGSYLHQLGATANHALCWMLTIDSQPCALMDAYNNNNK
jgi:hypothetical protein